MAWGIGWEIVAIKFKIWGWPADCCRLSRLSGVPIEELSFIALMTLCVSTTTIITRDIFLTHHWLKKSKRKTK